MHFPVYDKKKKEEFKKPAKVEARSRPRARKEAESDRRSAMSESRAGAGGDGANPEAAPSRAQRARVGSFLERSFAPIRSESPGLASSSSPLASPMRQRRDTMRDALRRTVSNVKYGSLLGSLKDKSAAEARTGEAGGSPAGNPLNFKRSSFLHGESFRDAAEPGETDAMPSGDVFAMGTVVGARLAANSELGGWGKSLWCEWKVVNDENWSIVRGASEGTTHRALPSEDDGLYVWQNPLNLQLRTRTSFGWPKLCFTIFERDGLMSTDTVFAYSLVSLPLDAGHHRMEARCWRPASRMKCIDNEMSVAYTGIRPELSRKSLVWEREGPYMNMQTVGVGTIELELNLVFSKEIEEIFDIELTESEGAKAQSRGDPLTGDDGSADEPLSEGLRIVRGRRDKRFNEVTSSMVAANMLKKSISKASVKFDATPGPSTPAVRGTPGSVAAGGTPLTPADQARADRRQRMQALMQDRAARRAVRAMRKNIEDQGGAA